MNVWIEAGQLVFSIVLAVVSLLIVAPLRRLADRVADIAERLAYIEGQLRTDELDQFGRLPGPWRRRRRGDDRGQDG